MYILQCILSLLDVLTERHFVGEEKNVSLHILRTVLLPIKLSRTPVTSTSRCISHIHLNMTSAPRTLTEPVCHIIKNKYLIVSIMMIIGCDVMVICELRTIYIDLFSMNCAIQFQVPSPRSMVPTSESRWNAKDRYQALKISSEHATCHKQR